jgi:hypothetical protein
MKKIAQQRAIKKDRAIKIFFFMVVLKQTPLAFGHLPLSREETFAYFAP